MRSTPAAIRPAHGRRRASSPTIPRALAGVLVGASLLPFAGTAAAARCETRIAALPTGPGPLAIADAAKPAVGRDVVDASHGTCVQRLTDHAASGAGRFMKTIYSRSQAFNADGSRVLVYGQDGRWRTVDARTSADLGTVPGIAGAASEPQWHATDPDLLYFLDEGGGDRLRRVNVATGQVIDVADFAGRIGFPGATRLQSGSSGSPSADQRRWAFVALDARGRALGIVVWDRVADRFTAKLDFAAAGLPATDTVSMSPSGRHVVGEWGAPTGVRAWRADLRGPGVKLNAKEEHSDLALLANGHDAYVSVDFDRTGQGFSTDIDEALRTGSAAPVSLFDIYPERTIHSMHFSGKAFDRPGWALVSTYDPRRTNPASVPVWMDRHVFAVELVPGGRQVGIAHDRVRALRDGEGKVYFAEPHASASRDFSAVAFNSNWGASDALDVDAYAVRGLDWRGIDGGDPNACDVRSASLRRTVAPRTWTLLGLPCRAPAGATVDQVLGDDLDGEAGTGWTLFTFDPATNAYAEAGGADPAPSPGRGFWFIHADDGPRELDLPAGSTRVATGGSGGAAAALAPDTRPSPWSIAANPLPVAADAAGLRVITAGGPCGAGCTLAQASARDVLDGPAYTYGGTAAGYLPIAAGRMLAPWDGLWAATGSAGAGTSPALVFGRGR